MGEKLESVRDFFDGHAAEYKTKYENGNSFYEYFFFERLDHATSGIDFSGKKILDIGAGTGPLYDYLLNRGASDFERYDATDLSGGMLAKSKIPESSRMVGDFLDLQIDHKYDLVFMLGVSTYLNPKRMEEHIQKIRSVLTPGGLFIVTFTNKLSLDIQIRNLLTPVIRLFAGKNRIIAQDFETWFYSLKRAKMLLDSALDVRSVEGLNHTFFPLSRIFPGMSIALAKKISILKEGKVKFWLSSDLLFFARNRD